MNQRQILELFNDYTNMPPRLRVELLSHLKNLFRLSVYNRLPIALPYLGKIVVEARAAKRRYDINDESVKEFAARNVVLMRRYSAGQQQLSPSYHSWKTYKKESERNNNQVSYDLRNLSGLDLLTCQVFVQTLINIIILLCENNETARISQIGSFNPKQVFIPIIDPVMNNDPIYGFTFNLQLGLYFRVSVGSGGFYFSVSDDLKSWSNYSFASGEGALTCAYSNPLAKVCMMGSNDLTFITWVTDDGTTFTRHSTAFDFIPLFSTWVHTWNIFVAVGYNFGNGAIAISDDGINWSMPNDGCIDIGYGAAFSTILQRLVIVGDPISTQSLAYTDNGTDWTGITAAAGRVFRSIAYNEKIDKFAATWTNGSQDGTAFSTDAINWTYEPVANGVSLAAIASGRGQMAFVAAGQNSTNGIIFNSRDGASFSSLNPQINHHPYGLFYIEKSNKFISYGTSSTKRNLAASWGSIRWFVSRQPDSTPPARPFRTLITYRPSKILNELAN